MPHIPNIMTFDYEHLGHAHLIRVIPVGVTRAAGEIAFTLMSLELYEAGFIAALLIEQRDVPISDGPGQPPFILRGMPAIVAHDELGREYVGRPRAGAGRGGGRSGSAATRCICLFTPTLNPDARSLSLEVEWVERLGWNADGSPTWSAADVVAGPTAFTFPIDTRPLPHP